MLIDSYNIAANFSFDKPLYRCATSGIPTSPKNKVSPVKIECCLPFSSKRRSDELSSVCPGVCINCILILPISKKSSSAAIIQS